MNILAICGAANKSRNTATMLKNAFKGATSVPGAAGEFITMYDVDNKGCIGCHSCKLLDESRFARCAVSDGLSNFRGIAKPLMTWVIALRKVYGA